MKKAALIDMDGVLYDSMKLHTLAWYRMMTELGIPCERDEFYLYEGMTGKATINRLFQRAYGRDASQEE
ncbi:MAG: beta-phosphoglucomutase, partial [Muribaculaceae bacterium]|nr:beta-phosphoglucomutase [Muribaculaceae bacterium]